MDPTQKTVMIVEDEAAIRGLLSIVLEDENYRVETAADGQEALDKLHAHRPDAILLDLMLPHVDGWSVIMSLSADSHPDDIPIVAVSGGQRYTAVGEHGVHAFLSKPFDLETLLTVLEQVLPSGQRP